MLNNYFRCVKVFLYACHHKNSPFHRRKKQTKLIFLLTRYSKFRARKYSAIIAVTKHVPGSMLNYVLLVSLKLKAMFEKTQWNEKHCPRETERMPWKCCEVCYIGQPTSHHGGVGSIPAQVMWGVWWTKCYSTNCFIFINNHIVTCTLRLAFEATKEVTWKRLMDVSLESVPRKGLLYHPSRGHISRTYRR
jgi:hypothetical protein